jgi:nitroreductase
MDLYDAMKKRRSVRKFRAEAVSRETLEKLVAAAILAPSGCNAQGWVFVVVDDPSARRKIAAACKWGRFIGDAAACVAVFCDKTTLCLVEDCAAATENLMLAAVAEGLGTCWVNSHKLPHAPAIERLLGCPESHELAVLIAVGVPEEIPASPEKKPLGAVLRWNKF